MVLEYSESELKLLEKLVQTANAQSHFHFYCSLASESWLVVSTTQDMNNVVLYDQLKDFEALKEKGFVIFNSREIKLTNYPPDHQIKVNQNTMLIVTPRAFEYQKVKIAQNDTNSKDEIRIPIKLSPIVRIKNAKNIVLGTGFSISQNHIFTCAHVINAASKSNNLPEPSEVIHLDFPFIAPKQTLQARIIYWQPAGSDGTGDVAVLELLDTPLDGVHPAKLLDVQNPWGRTFKTFGFPHNHDEGIWSSGVLREQKVNGHIQIEDTKVTGYSIQPGFSGAPVWDDHFQAVTGMIVTTERKLEPKVAFMIPSSKLIEVWNLIKDQFNK